MTHCMRGVHLKRLGEAVQGLAEFAPEEGGWIFVKRADARKMEYAFTAEEAERVRAEHDQAGEDWLEVQFCGSEPPTPQKRGFTVTVQADGAEPKTFRAGHQKVDEPRGLAATDPDPSWIDAVFFTRSAVEKFVVPYYAGLYGAELAQAILKEYEEGPEGRMVALHGPMSITRSEPMDALLREGFVNVDELVWRALE